MTTMRKLENPQRELVLGDLLDSLGHDLRIRVEWYGNDGLEGMALEGTVFAEDKALFEKPIYANEETN